MTPSTPPPLRDLTSRRFAAGGPPVTWWVFQPAGGAVAFGAARAGASPTGLTGAEGRRERACDAALEGVARQRDPFTHVAQRQPRCPEVAP